MEGWSEAGVCVCIIFRVYFKAKLERDERERRALCPVTNDC